MKPSLPPPPKPAECPAWMMTFGDCMSLLVCFFVMLIAFSNMEEDKLIETLGAMKGALNGVEPIDKPLLDDIRGNLAEPLVDADWLSTKNDTPQTENFLTVEEMAGMVPLVIHELRANDKDKSSEWPDRLLIRMLDDGMSIIVRTRTLFRPGSAEWLNGETGLWKGFAQLLEGRGNALRITSVLSSRTTVEATSAKSVWGLGVMRAETVAHAMEAAMKTSPARIGVGVQLHTGEQEGDSDSIEITILGHNKGTGKNAENSVPKGVL